MRSEPTAGSDGGAGAGALGANDGGAVVGAGGVAVAGPPEAAGVTQSRRGASGGNGRVVGVEVGAVGNVGGVTPAGFSQGRGGVLARSHGFGGVCAGACAGGAVRSHGRGDGRAVAGVPDGEDGVIGGAEGVADEDPTGGIAGVVAGVGVAELSSGRGVGRHRSGGVQRSSSSGRSSSAIGEAAYRSLSLSTPRESPRRRPGTTRRRLPRGQQRRPWRRVPGPSRGA